MSPPNLTVMPECKASGTLGTGLVSVSTAPYDGYDLERTLESIARIGAGHLELSEPIGYRARVHESWYSPQSAAIFAAALKCHGLQCHAVSAHLDLLEAGERREFAQRLDFAQRVGAEVVNVFAGPKRREREAIEALRWAAGLASEFGLMIGLENSADGGESLLNLAADAPRLLEQIGCECVGLTYDLGNTLTHRPAVDPVSDALVALPYCVHLHMKGLRQEPEGLFYAALGEGCLDPAELVRAAMRRGVSMAIELPLRQHRQPDGGVGRSRYRVALRDIEVAVATSLRWIHSCSVTASLVEQACV